MKPGGDDVQRPDIVHQDAGTFKRLSAESRCGCSRCALNIWQEARTPPPPHCVYRGGEHDGARAGRNSKAPDNENRWFDPLRPTFPCRGHACCPFSHPPCAQSNEPDRGIEDRDAWMTGRSEKQGRRGWPPGIPSAIAGTSCGMTLRVRNRLQETYASGRRSRRILPRFANADRTTHSDTTKCSAASISGSSSPCSSVYASRFSHGYSSSCANARCNF